MAIKRNGNAAVSEARFSVGLNIILSGSKKMSPAEQEALMSVDAVRVLIVDASDEGNVLVDELADAKEFTTGSVGYGVNLRGCTFKEWRE